MVSSKDASIVAHRASCSSGDGRKRYARPFEELENSGQRARGRARWPHSLPLFPSRQFQTSPAPLLQNVPCALPLSPSPAPTCVSPISCKLLLSLILPHQFHFREHMPFHRGE